MTALSALVVVRNEEAQLAECLSRLAFADEVVVVLDRCTDASRNIAAGIADRLVEGGWDRDGDRRNTGIDACTGPWIIEVDADERVTPALAEEIRALIETTDRDVFDVPVDNLIGGRLVRHGWMTAMGKTMAPCLFRKGTKTWGPQRAHPHLTVTGRKGALLKNALEHHYADGISDILMRLDRNTTARAGDLRESGEIGVFANMVRKIFSRFWKCYVLRRGYREPGYGVMIALCAALYPVLSHLKARLEDSEPGA